MANHWNNDHNAVYASQVQAAVTATAIPNSTAGNPTAAEYNALRDRVALLTAAVNKLIAQATASGDLTAS